jgi:hypothetical protein
MNDLLAAIAEGWSWKLGLPVELLATNQFGNTIVRNSDGHYFRIIPEEWQCELLARSPEELGAKRQSPEFVRDWEMAGLVRQAQIWQGPLAEGRVYCLVTPGVLGGKYAEDNIRTITLRELLSYSGCMARQIEGLPNGTKVEIVVKK